MELQARIKSDIKKLFPGTSEIKKAVLEELYSYKPTKETWRIVTLLATSYEVLRDEKLLEPKRNAGNSRIRVENIMFEEHRLKGSIYFSGYAQYLAPLKAAPFQGITISNVSSNVFDIEFDGIENDPAGDPGYAKAKEALIKKLAVLDGHIQQINEQISGCWAKLKREIETTIERQQEAERRQQHFEDLMNS